VSIRRRQKQSESAQPASELTPEQLEQAEKKFAERNAELQKRAQMCLAEINQAKVEISKKYNCRVDYVSGDVQIRVTPN